MPLPNLSSLTCVRCNDDIGVTRQSFTPLLPGMSFKEGIREEDVLEPNDLECAICGNFLNHPFDGFSIEKGDSPEIVEAEENFSKLKIPTEIDAARSEFYRKGSDAADLIRKRDPVRTQLEILDPGCKHQFHKECISNWCNSGRSNSKNCPLCQIPIDGQLFLSLTGQGSSSASGSSSSSGVGLVRQRSSDAVEEEEEDIFEGLPPFGPVNPNPNPNNNNNNTPLLPDTANMPIPADTEANRYRRYFRLVLGAMTQLEFLLGRFGNLYDGEREVWRPLSSHMAHVQPRYILEQIEQTVAVFSNMYPVHSQFQVLPMENSQPYFEWDELIGRCYFIYRSFAAENELFHTRSRTSTIASIMGILINMVKTIVRPLTDAFQMVGVVDEGDDPPSFSGWTFGLGLTGTQPNTDPTLFPEILLVKLTGPAPAPNPNPNPIFSRLGRISERIYERLNSRNSATNELTITGLEREVYHNFLTFTTMLWRSSLQVLEESFGELDNTNLHIDNFFSALVNDFDDEYGELTAPVWEFNDVIRGINASRV